MKKIKFRIEYLLYLFIILSPFFDMMSYLYRTYVSASGISPSIILRPIIPIILCLYILVKDKKARTHFLIGGIIYATYLGIHLFLVQSLLTIYSYGTLFSELQFVVNYSYMIFLLYAILWFMKNRTLSHFKTSLLWMLACYLGLIFLAMLTHTSSPTYVEGIGDKGWNMSGNGLSAILVLSYAFLLPTLVQKRKKWWTWALLLSLFFFLLFLFGTKTGFLGVILLSACYLFFHLTLSHKKQKKIPIFKIGVAITSVLVVGVILMLAIGPKMLERQKHLSEIEHNIIDPLTQNPAHLTGDITSLVVEIKKGNIKEGDLRLESQNAFLKLYDFSQKYKIKQYDQRTQQLVYHTFLFFNQKDPMLFLFGNGYQSHFRELTLEMEVPAMLYNFGIIGFVIFLGPIIVLGIKGIQGLRKGRGHLTTSYMMYLVGVLLAFLLSFLTGYVYFYTPSMLVVICGYALLQKEREMLE